MTTMDSERLARAWAKVGDAEQAYYRMVQELVYPGRMEWIEHGGRLLAVRVIEPGERGRVLVEGATRRPYWVDATRFVGPR